MLSTRFVGCAVALMAALPPSPATAQQGRDPASLVAAQRAAMLAVRVMDGVWRGTAWTLLPSGEKHVVTQTERIGPFLDGSVKVIEGRRYEADGSVSFIALGIISYKPDTRAYAMRSYAQGTVADFVLTPTADGFVSELTSGSVTFRYTAVVKGGTFHESGDRIASGAAPVRVFEMDLTRAGDTDWPAAGTITAK